MSKHQFPELPPESVEALITSMKEVVLESTGLEISVRWERYPVRNGDLTMFVVALPEHATPEQRAEADYWLNEIAPLFRYAEPSAKP